MLNNQTKIGEIVSVSGNTITVQLLDTIKSNSPIIDGIVYRIGQIGSFFKVPLGYSILYGIVTQIGASAIPESMQQIYLENFDKLSNMQWINIVLVGEQIGKRFERGISQSPTTGDAVHLVTIDDLEIVYGGYVETGSITMGNISISESLPAKIDFDKFLSRHSAIVGSTGSGKSNAVGVLLSAIVEQKYKSPRVLVIDPHGEYNSILPDSSSVYKVKYNDDQENETSQNLYVPFWALPFNELISIFEANLSEQKLDYIRQKIIEKKLILMKNSFWE